MREIKFRGKRVDNGEWVHGCLIYSLGRAWIKDINDIHINPRRIEKGTADFRCVESIPETIGQFTGLIDKNGVEIYEGDLLSTDLSREYLIVVFRNGDFQVQCHDDGKDYFDNIVPLESECGVAKYSAVIGNIHDNPELLEVSNG